MNQTLDQGQLSRNKQNSVDILFKGLKRKVSQRSYSKIKNSYKKKPVENQQLIVPFANSTINRPKLKLSVVSNRIVDPQLAHEQLLKLKQANHNLFQQNAQLLRKIRKEQKIEEIYRKKLQGRQIADLDYFRALQIKLLLQVQLLQNQFEEKQNLFQQKMTNIRTKKHSFKDQIIRSRMTMYELMIQSPQDLSKIQKQKKNILSQKQKLISQLHEKTSKTRSKKQQKNEILNQIKNQIKELREKFKSVEAQSKRDKNSSQMLNITSLMSSLMTSAQKSQVNKEPSSAILKNNVSSISVKNKNNIEQIEKEIEKIKEECQMINNEIQEFMDEKIKQKILIHKQIHAIEQIQRKQREKQNRNMICHNGAFGRNPANTTASRIERSANPMKCSIVFG